jgi:hypothetical protein
MKRWYASYEQCMHIQQYEAFALLLYRTTRPKFVNAGGHEEDLLHFPQRVHNHAYRGWSCDFARSR